MDGDMAEPDRVVVMTGGTAGLGAHAARHIADQSDTRLIIGVRGTGRTVPPGAEALPLDLASLDSVRAFAEAVQRGLGDMPIDILVLNAGLQNSKTDRRSADGYELTFAVNHLAHYLLVRLLLPCMAEGGLIELTTSETHDPARSPMAPKGLDLDLQELAHPTKSGFGSGPRVYATSKLCNLMTAESLADLDEVKARNIAVVAFSPGLTGGTSMGRDASPVSRFVVTTLMHTVFRVIGLFKPEYIIGTPERSGEALAEVALRKVVPPPGRIYLSLVKGQPTYPDPSQLALSPEKQEQLWRESAAMVGLT